ncbi:DUF4199 domain-containing protein [Mesonia maritima]|uniref:DUF4199 domain-containing protein n=1 Tax=Mesonia maritima TaxID=1793873 RepID=A0ABU1K4H9_9FLAO|nr:DUF4199 domain-containing protein [Mesonia maritima]MDR6300498.1 hypothetical protein [Mesonia maritima]
MKNFRIEFKWAIIFSVFTLIWMVGEKSIGLHDELIAKQAVYTNLIAIPYIIIFFLAIKDKRDNYYNGIMSWKQGVISGGVLSVIIAVLAPIVQYVVSTLISPEFFQHAIDHAVESGRMKRDGAASLYNLNFFLIQAIFGSLAMGVVTSAIVAAFLKKSPKND